MNQEIPWDEFATKALVDHNVAICKAAEEIARRCKLKTVNDYTVKMAIQEMVKANEAIQEAANIFNQIYVRACYTADPEDGHQAMLMGRQLVYLMGKDNLVVDNHKELLSNLEL